MRQAMIDYMDANQPVTALEMSKALGITRQSIYEHHKKGSIHIVGWERIADGHPTALYELGKGRDVPRPKAYTQEERSAAYQLRHSAVIRARRPTKTQTELGVWAGLVC